MKKLYSLALIFSLQTAIAMEKAMLTTIGTTGASITPEKVATFCQVKKILSITKAIAEDLHTRHNLWLQDGPSTWPESNPYYYRTKNGLKLFCGTYPSHLGTPWGEVKIYGSGGGKGADFTLATKFLFQRVHTAFLRCPKLWLGYNQGFVGEVPQQAVDEKLSSQERSVALWSKELSDQEISDAIGSSKIIITNMESSYAIKAIDGEPCPEMIEVVNFKEERPDDEVVTEWAMLEKAYQAAQAQAITDPSK
jgi:hypothetical protein